MAVLDGIDVAMWQGTIDWSQVAKVGLKFVCFQVGWRNDDDQRLRGIMELDPYYRRNVVGARTMMPNAKRIHYVVPINRPWREQLDYALSLIGPLPAGETVMFDVEYPQVVQMGFESMVAMHREAEQRLQRRCFWYGGGYFPSEPSWIEDDRIADIPKWFAAYSDKDAMLNRHAVGVENLVVWQWGGGAQGAFIPGIWDGKARVDSNEILNLAAFEAAFGGERVATGESHNPALIKAWTSDYQSRKVVRPRGIVWHTIVNSGDVTWQGFRAGAHGADTTRAQYADRDGKVYEIQPPDRKFLASWQGDEFVLNGVRYGHIAYETEDEVGVALGPYTPAQREGLIAAAVQDCLMWNIPAVVPKVGDWTAAGIHYHSLHGLNTHHSTKPTTDPFGFNYYDSDHGYWVRVVNPLTKTVGKTCPGADKIAQHAGMVAEVARRLAIINKPTDPLDPPNKGVDMPVLVKGDAVASGPIKPWPGDGDSRYVWEALSGVAVHIDDEDYVEAMRQGGAPVRTMSQALVDKIPKMTRAALFPPESGGAGGGGTQTPVVPWRYQIDSVPGVATPLP